MAHEIVISDTHFGPYREKRDRPRLEFLRSIIRVSDRVIINGDFWDNWWINYHDFTRSGWSELFRPLREKNAVYITGNHDGMAIPKKKLFWVVAVRTVFHFSRGGTDYAVLHGHTLDSWRHADQLVEHRFVRALYPIGKWLQEHALTDGFSKRLYRLYKTWNEEQKTQLDKLYKPSVWKIVGHTHLAEFDVPRRYINAGMVDTHLKRTSYVAIHDNGPRLVNQFTPRPFEQ